MPKKKRVKYSNGGGFTATRRFGNIAEFDLKVGLSPERMRPVLSAGVKRGRVHSEVYGGVGGPERVTTSIQDTPIIGGTTVSKVDLNQSKYTISNFRNIGDAQLEVYGGTQDDPQRGQGGIRISVPFGK